MFFFSFAAINFIPAVLDVTTWPTTSWTVSISTFDFTFCNEILYAHLAQRKGFVFICSCITISCFVHQLPFEFFLLFDPGSGHNQALVQVSPEFTICSFEMDLPRIYLHQDLLMFVSLHSVWINHKISLSIASKGPLNIYLE